MQLATVNGGKPWVCTVYYVVDDNNNLYWLSLPSRRHSLDIAQNSNVAATIPIKFDLPVIGIQMEGQASEVRDIDTISAVMERYVHKYDAGKTFLDRYKSGENEHKMYVLKPDHIYIFDEVNSSEGERQEV